MPRARGVCFVGSQNSQVKSIDKCELKHLASYPHPSDKIIRITPLLTSDTRRKKTCTSYVLHTHTCQTVSWLAIDSCNHT